MNFGRFLDNGTSGGRITSEINIPYTNISSGSVSANHSKGENGGGDSTTDMTTGAVAQPRYLTTPLSKPIMFNSSGLSLALQTGIDRHGDVGLLGESFEASILRRRSRESMEQEHESRSGSDNMEGAASGDDQDADDKPPRKKRYHRHTPQQIQELEKYDFML